MADLAGHAKSFVQGPHGQVFSKLMLQRFYKSFFNLP